MKNDILVQDTVYYRYDYEGELEYVNTSRHTLYFETMMTRAEQSKSGAMWRKAANNFYSIQRLYNYLQNNNYLTEEYCVRLQPIRNGLEFTLNVTKLLENNPKLKQELYSRFKDIHKQVCMLISPPKSLRCKTCGAYTLSRIEPLFARELSGLCTKCETLSYDENKRITDIRKRNGVIEASIEKYNNIDISNIDIEKLISEFIDRKSVNEESYPLTLTKLLLNKQSDEYEAFGTKEYGLVILNKSKLKNKNDFLKVFTLNTEMNSIIDLLNFKDVLMTGNLAIKFAQSLANNDLEKDALADAIYPYF